MKKKPTVEEVDRLFEQLREKYYGEGLGDFEMLLKEKEKIKSKKGMTTPGILLGFAFCYFLLEKTWHFPGIIVVVALFSIFEWVFLMPVQRKINACEGAFWKAIGVQWDDVRESYKGSVGGPPEGA